MQVKNFRSVVIKGGLIVGHMTGKIMVVGNDPTTVLYFKQQPLNSEIDFGITSVDASKLQAVTAWGDITHIYEIQGKISCSNEKPGAVSVSHEKTSIPKSSVMASSLTDSAELA